MSDQPKALRLAEIMEQKAKGQKNCTGDYWGDAFCCEAAAELRRLHKVEAELDAETKTHLEAESHSMAIILCLKAQRDAAVKAITHHNNACQNLCGTGHFEASACGYRSHFEATGRRCPECPTYYKIDWPQDAAIDAAKEDK